jgi:hypothetical protein
MSVGSSEGEGQFVMGSGDFVTVAADRIAESGGFAVKTSLR